MNLQNTVQASRNPSFQITSRDFSSYFQDIYLVSGIFNALLCMLRELFQYMTNQIVWSRARSFFIRCFYWVSCLNRRAEHNDINNSFFCIAVFLDMFVVICVYICLNWSDNTNEVIERVPPVPSA